MGKVIERGITTKDKILYSNRHCYYTFFLQKGGGKLAASSMQHEAKIAYYAFDVIRFFVPYTARLKLRGRVAR